MSSIQQVINQTCAIIRPIFTTIDISLDIAQRITDENVSKLKTAAIVSRTAVLVLNIFSLVSEKKDLSNHTLKAIKGIELGARMLDAPIQFSKEEKKETQVLSLPSTEANEAGFISLPTKPVSNYQIKQQKVLAKLAQDLPAMMEVWNVDSFQILTSEQMLAEGYEYEAAYSGDRILLFHKRIENPEDAIAAMDPLSI